MTQRPPLEQIIQQLNNISLFAGLDETTQRELAQACRIREHETSEVVVLEGDAQPALYYLQHGWLKVVKVSLSGCEQTLRFLEPSETFWL